MSDESKMSLPLSKDEVIVLFEWLSRISQSGELKKLVEDEAEAILANRIVCHFEKILVEPFLENYSDILERSRQKIKDEGT